MSFAPVLAGGGLSGWLFLRRTLDTQQAAFASSAGLRADADHFRSRISDIRTADELLSDRRSLRVALSAFGLEDDVGNRAFLRRVLTDDPSQRDALTNRLADKRYLGFAQAFGLWPGGPTETARPDFADRILDTHRSRQFEQAVGAQDESMRLALNALRELPALATRGGEPDTAWFAVMGSPPLRRVMEGALGLPRNVGTLDIDQQLGIFRSKARSAFGNGEVSQFQSGEAVEGLIRRFLVRSQAAEGLSGFGSVGAGLPTSPALQLLRAGINAGQGPLLLGIRTS